MTDLLELGANVRLDAEAIERAHGERAESRDSAHALIARAVVQLRTAMATLRDANHAADPVTHLILLDCMRDLGAVENRVKSLEHAMSMQGKRT